MVVLKYFRHETVHTLRSSCRRVVDSFSLSAPKEYEIEALEIFTPDVLANLLDNKFGHDVEFVNQEMLIFFDGRISNSEQLDREFRRALDLEDLLDEKLDKFKTETIGDMSASL